jgi:transposase
LFRAKALLGDLIAGFSSQAFNRTRSSWQYGFSQSPASPNQHRIRQEIKDSGLSPREAAKVFNVTRATAQKWLRRDDVQDRSHRAHTLHTTLSAAQEATVLALRQSLYLPLDDLVFITKQYINADVSRSGVARLLKREGMALGRRSPAANTPSTSLVPTCLSSIAWRHRATRKPTVWSSVSTGVSTTCYSRPISIAGPACKPLC